MEIDYEITEDGDMLLSGHKKDLEIENLEEFSERFEDFIYQYRNLDFVEKEETDSGHRLARQAIKEIRERQAEMSECNHLEITRDDEGDRAGWYCNKCDMKFTPKAMSGSFEIEKMEFNVEVSENQSFSKQNGKTEESS